MSYFGINLVDQCRELLISVKDINFISQSVLPEHISVIVTIQAFQV